MIRDPSDGSVKEITKSGPVRKAPQNIAERLPSSDAAGSGPDTGIRQPTKTDAMARLEFSREWLKAYHAKKGTAHARGNDGTEHSTDGRSSNDQGQAQSAVSGGNGANPGTHREG